MLSAGQAPRAPRTNVARALLVLLLRHAAAEVGDFDIGDFDDGSGDDELEAQKRALLRALQASQ